MSASAAALVKPKSSGGPGQWNHGHNAPPPPPTQHDLPDERQSVTKKLTMAGGWDIYVTAGFYPSGQIGEVFVVCNKPGSTLRGDLDAWAISISKALQRGTPLQDIVKQYSNIHAEPNGFVPGIGFCTSLQCAVVRWLEQRFVRTA